MTDEINGKKNRNFVVYGAANKNEAALMNMVLGEIKDDGVAGHHVALSYQEVLEAIQDTKGDELVLMIHPPGYSKKGMTPEQVSDLVEKAREKDARIIMFGNEEKKDGDVEVLVKESELMTAEGLRSLLKSG